MSIQEIDMKVQELRELQALVEEATTQIEAIKGSTPRHTVKKRRTLSFGYLSTQSYPHPSKFTKREKAKICAFYYTLSDGKIVEAPLKTKNSYRTVAISQQAAEVLRQQKAKINDEYVFPSPNGGPISPDSVNNLLKRVLARAGISRVRFHDLRHTFATVALQNGVDIKTVSGMLGHFSAGFTLDTYAHVTTAAQMEAAKTIACVLSL